MHLAPNEIISLMSVIVAFASLVFVAITYAKNGKKEIKNEVEKEESRYEELRESTIKINLKLDGLCATANETRTDVKAMNKDLVQLQAHITTLDDKMSNMESRLTTLEKAVYDR